MRSARSPARTSTRPPGALTCASPRATYTLDSLASRRMESPLSAADTVASPKLSTPGLRSTTGTSSQTSPASSALRGVPARQTACAVAARAGPSSPEAGWRRLAKQPAGASFTIMATIGIIGAGQIGSQLARLAVKNGDTVVISNSRGPETLSGLVAELGPNARAATPAEAGAAGESVVVTVPLKNYRAMPVDPLAGKVVIDTNNYYPQRDGHIPELDNESTTTAELLQAHLPTSKVVKAFNHIYAAALTTEGQPAGSKNRRALVIAGDDQAAKATVSRLIDRFGFDVVDAGPLKEGWRIQRDTPGYGPRRNAEELRRDLAAAKRYSDR